MIIKSAMYYFNNILYVISFVFILLLSLYAYDNSVNMLWADEWDTPGNLIYKEINDPINVSIYDFTSQHNESRKIIPKIIYYAAYIAGFFDTRIGVLIRILLSILSVMVISHICNTSDGKDSVKYLLVTLCIFIPTQAYNQIFGLQFITIVPSFCLIIILLINKNIKSLTTGLFLSIIFCIISTFTYSNGLIIWALSNPLVFKLLGVRNFKLYHILSFNFVFLLTLIFYFYDYQHPSHHPGMLKGILNPLRTIEYFTLWLWSPFVIHLPHPKYLCFILTISYFFLLIFLLFHIKILYIPTRKVCFSILCPVILLFYGIFSGCIASLGRSGFGVKAALGPQYPSFALWAHLGLILLFFNIPLNKKLLRISFFTSYAFLYILCFEGGIADFKKWSYKMKQCKLSVENLDICPQNPLISDFHLAPETVKIKAKSFAKNHILKFSGNQWILKAVPHHNTNCGFVTTTVNTHTVNLFGWATIPGTKKPADYILVATKIDNQIIPISLLLLELKRDDVNKALNANKNIVFGFDKTLKISHADNQIYSYAVDNDQKQIYKLNEF